MAEQRIPPTTPRRSSNGVSLGVASPASHQNHSTLAHFNPDDDEIVPGDDDEGFRDADNDDGYESDVSFRSTRTQSLTPSVRDYVFQDGRRYHAYREGRYHFPNDQPEQDRELVKHDVMLILNGERLHSAPLRNPQSILDVGTGIGAWADEMGEEYPGAYVVGIDLSPIQPEYLPPNVRFIIDDAERPWADPPNTLDFVRLGNMAPSIRDWPTLFERAYTSLKPGGWIELHEFRWVYGCDDGTMPPGFVPVRMVANLTEALAMSGVDMNAAERNPARLDAAGFVNISHQVKKVPVGQWPQNEVWKLIGSLVHRIIYDGLEAITLRPFTQLLGWSSEEVSSFLDEVRRDLSNPSVHSYVYFHVLTGQKPLYG